MFASYCGQYEESFCQHPDGPKTSFDDLGWREWYDTRYPKCPLVQSSITIIAD